MQNQQLKEMDLIDLADGVDIKWKEVGDWARISLHVICIDNHCIHLLVAVCR